MRSPRFDTLRRSLLALAVLVATAALVPRWWCGRDAGAWLEGDLETERALADTVAARALLGVQPSDLHTGSEHFDGEWALVQNQMTVLGLGQIATEHPPERARYLPAMRAAIAGMLTPEARAFGTRAWGGEDGIEHLESEHGHVYLGYIDLALGMLRWIDPAMDPSLVALHDRLTDALARRLASAPHALIETFPGVTFPADVASAVGAIGLHARVTGRGRRALLEAWGRAFRRCCVDPGTGFVYQTVEPRTGEPSGAPRGSGTALVVYFLSFADRALALDLDAAVARGGIASFLGFGGVREYPAAAGAAGGDIDSGPVVFGVSVAASGFGLAGARMTRDEARFRALFRTAYLFGAPVSRGGGARGFLAGPGLGDAILLATMTAKATEDAR
jgi:hypothetical protein